MFKKYYNFLDCQTIFKMEDLSGMLIKQHLSRVFRTILNQGQWFMPQNSIQIVYLNTVL